jgi:uncharacterized protein (TIGR03067 family)
MKDEGAVVRGCGVDYHCRFGLTLSRLSALRIVPMKMRWIICALAVAVAPTLVRADGDADKLKGKWSAKVGPNQDVPITIEFKDKSLEIAIETGDGQNLTIHGEYKLDEKAKPKTIDFLNFKSDDGNAHEDNKGIYELTGDTLKICTGGPGNTRPTEFFPAEEGGRGTITLSRVK